MQMFEDLDSGKFIQQNFDSLLRRDEGKQLCVEVTFWFFVLLEFTFVSISGSVSSWSPAFDC